MNDEATLAIQWTRRQLNPDQLEFLASLPLEAEDGDRLYVHASAAEPAAWDYVMDERSAGRSLRATDAALTFCGHVHVPAVFHLSSAGKIAGFDPDPEVAIPLTRQRRWLAVIGAVGQPRDRNPAACYALYDDAARTLTYVRVPYDIESAARKIRDAGLPAFLAARLAVGR
jgi:diadenosine tetraphosphatase ApaH/serine/threonine PP2A family protein phosphatase